MVERDQDEDIDTDEEIMLYNTKDVFADLKESIDMFNEA